MLNKIISFSIKNKFIIGLFTFFLIIWGVWSAIQLPIDAVPDITNNQVQIITQSPTLATQEVEQLVTFPIEQSLANLPKLVESRSISRFGLSVITVVFEDDLDIYLARQLINERLQDVAYDMPKGIGLPKLAPVSTGLGEVYQYTLQPKKGSFHKYSTTELRTMQDWIVARQLNGTPGVAEVNSFGGNIKLYEVVLNPKVLQGFGISVSDVFDALEKNNQNTGGAYIDKKPNAYFIRGVGMVNNLTDIKNIVVKKIEGQLPVLIKDVAEVKFGSAVRYGALTVNGQHESVGGIVMMLKGSNSNEVVKRIKEKLPQIQKTLPNDISIEPFIDRSNFVGRAIETVRNNLIEGALIVIFVLVLFLGNLRAGLIVASAIPLSMLFALAMMNLFGVSANLMSLGAIDFGLIVDGAVIIVEASLYYLEHRKTKETLTQEDMDNAVSVSATKMMNNAIFGQIIIMIVYFPILSLVGIEGKMFVPMAKTVSFAILGAMILSLTYIPMMSALFLSKNMSHHETFSDKMINYLNSIYQPFLKKCIDYKYKIVGFTLSLLALSIFIFSKLGGEFIPNLAEGDFAFEFIMPLETSLSQSVETSMKASQIARTFQEVKMVVGKTGTSEVPTDPMPPGATDLMIILKPKDQWTTGRSYEELGDALEEKMRVIPGVFIEKNQPIQIRFNELMTGVKQDVAIKIFGENLDSLATYAEKVKKSIHNIEGVSSINIEKVEGLPQISVEYNRKRLAQYQLNVEDVNNVISTAFAGKTAGSVYENERKFDLVVRLDSTYRSNIEDVNNLIIPVASGAQIPLSQVAKVGLTLGPAQISREMGKRRIVIGFNVQNRDVESVVEDIQKKIGHSIKLPTGYYFTYGGTFENLQKATERLLLAVPLSLLLIYILLYFAFGSVKQATLIFTAIPMSAIGGVFALWMRGMPFSISAGIGFIALFGVAVLNGIVLIGTFNQLRNEGEEDVFQRIYKGTKMRLRPVLMTAVVASLGFLPMAISQGSGAEVQKPLATVVIGGLVSATLLTLLVLPLLYLIFSHSFQLKWNKTSKSALTLIIFFFISMNSFAQNRKSLDEVLEMGTKNNLNLQLQKLYLDKSKVQIGSNRVLNQTGFFVENEDIRPSDTKGILKIGFTQNFFLPQVNSQLKQKDHLVYDKNQLELEINLLNLKKEIISLYYQLWYLEEKKGLYDELQIVFQKLEQNAQSRLKTGDIAGIEAMASNMKWNQNVVLLKQLEQEILQQKNKLATILKSNLLIEPLKLNLEKRKFNLKSVSEHPILTRQEKDLQIADKDLKIQQNEKLPSFSARLFTQKWYEKEDAFSGFSVGISLPLFNSGAISKKIESTKIDKMIASKSLDVAKQELELQQNLVLMEIQKQEQAVDFFQKNALQKAIEISKAVQKSYQLGNISFAEMSVYLGQSLEIRANYLEQLNAYNQAVIQYQFFTNNF